MTTVSLPEARTALFQRKLYKRNQFKYFAHEKETQSAKQIARIIN